MDLDADHFPAGRVLPCSKLVPASGDLHVPATERAGDPASLVEIPAEPAEHDRRLGVGHPEEHLREKLRLPRVDLDELRRLVLLLDRRVPARDLLKPEEDDDRVRGRDLSAPDLHRHLFFKLVVDRLGAVGERESPRRDDDRREVEDLPLVDAMRHEREAVGEFLLVVDADHRAEEVEDRVAVEELGFRGPEDPRVEDPALREEVERIVPHRRTGEAYPLAGFGRDLVRNCPRRLRSRVGEPVGFVEPEEAPPLLRRPFKERRPVEHERFVVRDDERRELVALAVLPRRLGVGDSLLDLLVSARRDRVLAIGVLRDLPIPDLDDGRRTNEESGKEAGIAGRGDVREVEDRVDERLRLARPHLPREVDGFERHDQPGPDVLVHPRREPRAGDFDRRRASGEDRLGLVLDRGGLKLDGRHERVDGELVAE